MGSHRAHAIAPHVLYALTCAFAASDASFAAGSSSAATGASATSTCANPILGKGRDGRRVDSGQLCSAGSEVAPCGSRPRPQRPQGQLLKIRKIRSWQAG